MGKEVTAVFDIGKTNKKFFLFDRDFHEVHREYTHLEPTRDEDGFPCEDLQALAAWMREVLSRALEQPKWEVRSLNFSTYGASLVHLDAGGNPLTPLYNYLKPYDTSLEDAFYARYGPQEEFSLITGTSRSGMLNSGLQLYWLRHRKPDIFRKIRVSLHLPQYLSYLFTGRAVSEYTSIGCHTALWDYRLSRYHPWVAAEGLDTVLAPIVPTQATYPVTYHGKALRVGVGIHDSSAALLPYLKSIDKPFALLSTGTWSIALNPFADGHLSAEDRRHDCINYMRVDGEPVKAARLFLGNEFKLQLKALSAHYGVPEHAYREVAFDPHRFERIRADAGLLYHWESLGEPCPPETRWEHPDYTGAYHQLLFELCLLQGSRLQAVLGGSGIQRLYVDGGFAGNDVFMEMLSRLVHPIRLRTTDASLGSALGAAVVLSDHPLKKGFLKTHYALRKHKPLTPP
jgi:sugar (pentulose or hexulose) kinase